VQGGTAFLGPWFGSLNQMGLNALATSEEMLIGAFKREGSGWRYGVLMPGVAYYEYGVLEDDLRSLGPNVPPRVCHWYGDGQWEPIDAARREGPVHRIDLRRGESYQFAVEAWDHDGNLTGTLWKSSAHAGGLRRVYVREAGGSGRTAVFRQTYRFDTPGEYRVRVATFDREESYAPNVGWVVVVGE